MSAWERSTKTYGNCRTRWPGVRSDVAGVRADVAGIRADLGGVQAGLVGVPADSVTRTNDLRKELLARMDRQSFWLLGLLIVSIFLPIARGLGR